MIIIYTSGRNVSCQYARHWFQKESISYTERRVNAKNPLTKGELNKIMVLTVNGFEDVLSHRSKFYKNVKNEFEDLTYEEAINLFIKRPELLKKPIIVDLETNKIEIGFNEEAMRRFLPRNYKRTQIESYKKRLTYFILD